MKEEKRGQFTPEMLCNLFPKNLHEIMDSDEIWESNKYTNRDLIKTLPYVLPVLFAYNNGFNLKETIKRLFFAALGIIVVVSSNSEKKLRKNYFKGEAKTLANMCVREWINFLENKELVEWGKFVETTETEEFPEHEYQLDDCFLLPVLPGLEDFYNRISRISKKNVTKKNVTKYAFGVFIKNLKEKINLHPEGVNIRGHHCENIIRREGGGIC